MTNHNETSQTWHAEDTSSNVRSEWNDALFLSFHLLHLHKEKVFFLLKSCSSDSHFPGSEHFLIGKCAVKIWPKDSTKTNKSFVDWHECALRSSRFLPFSLELKISWTDFIHLTAHSSIDFFFSRWCNVMLVHNIEIWNHIDESIKMNRIETKTALKMSIERSCILSLRKLFLLFHCIINSIGLNANRLQKSIGKKMNERNTLPFGTPSHPVTHKCHVSFDEPGKSLRIYGDMNFSYRSGFYIWLTVSFGSAIKSISESDVRFYVITFNLFAFFFAFRYSRP